MDVLLWNKDLSDFVLGYLPAEHIETPTERLARLNKHRNIDVGPICLIGYSAFY